MGADGEGGAQEQWRRMVASNEGRVGVLITMHTMKMKQRKRVSNRTVAKALTAPAVLLQCSVLLTLERDDVILSAALENLCHVTEVDSE
jgi:hypothetical protein